MHAEQAGPRGRLSAGRSNTRPAPHYYKILAVAGAYLILVVASGVQRNCAGARGESAATPTAVQQEARAAESMPAALALHRAPGIPA